MGTPVAHRARGTFNLVICTPVFAKHMHAIRFQVSSMLEWKLIV